MKVQFECSTCGEEIREFTRGREEANIHVECSGCGAYYVTTITQLKKGN